MTSFILLLLWPSSSLHGFILKIHRQRDMKRKQKTVHRETTSIKFIFFLHDSNLQGTSNLKSLLKVKPLST